MKQKIIIGLSVALLLAAVYMIARDLFHPSPSNEDSSCCGDDLTFLKKIEPSQIGYTKIKVIETGLKDLSGITVSKEQQVFVCGNEQVIVFDPSGKKVAAFGTGFKSNCIATDNENIYLGSGAGMVVYRKDGKKLASWNPFNPEGLITSVAAGNNCIFAADAISKRVLKYDLHGKLLLDIGKKDSLKGVSGFVIPSLYFDLAIGAFNDLWVANPGKQHIENYSGSGQLESEWGIAGNSNESFIGCCNPAHISILPNGSFVTYEKGIDKIKVFEPTGKFQCIVAGAGSFKGNTDYKLGSINLVKDIATGSDGRIYVLDAYNRINIFTKRDH